METAVFAAVCRSEDPGAGQAVGSEGAVRPKLFSVAHFVKLCNSYAVFVGRNVLCHYIHRNFGKIHIIPMPAVAVIPVVFNISRIIVIASSRAVIL